jgi:hypothetical protein
MIKVYGTANGFGWKLNEVVGAQVVSVPMSVPLENAGQAFRTFMGSLAAVFCCSLRGAQPDADLADHPAGVAHVGRGRQGQHR